METKLIEETIKKFKDAFQQFINLLRGDDFDEDKMMFLFRSDFPIGNLVREFTAAVVEVQKDPVELESFIRRFYVNGFAYNFLMFRTLRDLLLRFLSTDVEHSAFEDNTFSHIQEGYIYVLERLEEELRNMVAEKAGVDFIPLSSIKLDKFNMYGQYIPDVKFVIKNESEKVGEGSIIIAISEEYKQELLNELKQYFPAEQERQLKEVLDGELVTQKLIFKGTARQLVEVFRRLLYNGFITTSATEVREWLCSNFKYVDDQNGESTGKNLNSRTVYDYLTKSVGDIRVSHKRICNFGWLPYCNHEVLRQRKEQEKL